jgi:hypothetical protein
MIKALARSMVGYALLTLASAPAVANPILITNSSFEDPATTRAGTDSIPGWAESDASFYASGIWAPSAPSGDYSAIPDGSQVAFITRGSISQTLAAPLTASIRYDLFVDVGRSALDPLPATLYSVQLYAGSTLLAETTPTTPTAGSFALASLSYTASAGDPLLGQLLAVRLVHATAPATSDVNFDNVRLESTVLPGIPEPSTLALFMLGSLALLVRARRFR